MIHVAGLTKEYDGLEAVRGISFHVNAGEVFGLLGPNGAGKTSTIKMLTGLARITRGSALIGGYDASRDMDRIKAIIGVVPDESNLYDELTGFANLCFCGALYGMGRSEREARARELLRQFGLEESSDRPFRAYSRGMKRRLTIAAALMHRPRILFLDEPTTGVDVASARQIRQLLKELNASGVVIFLTTHYIEEAERLCHRIALIVRGEIVRTGSPQELVKACERDTVMQVTVGGPVSGLMDEMGGAFPDVRIERSGEESVKLRSARELDIYPVVAWLHGRGVKVLEARLVKPTLEDAFVALTSVSAAEMKREREKEGRRG
ncbi:MAG: ABC transporter ATP-binding protein [Bacillota bacterium]|jgi:ABC-2 type transport system ATP-binding protein|nr:ABC transporter ATP-binding protein [Bacillota bacterium]